MNDRKEEINKQIPSGPVKLALHQQHQNLPSSPILVVPFDPNPAPLYYSNMYSNAAPRPVYIPLSNLPNYLVNRNFVISNGAFTPILSNPTPHPIFHPTHVALGEFLESQSPPYQEEKRYIEENKIDASSASPKNRSSSSFITQKVASSSSSSSPISFQRSSKRRRKERTPSDGFNGEDRLTISFENFGEILDINVCPRIGNRDALIPNGLCGSFMMYGEKWQFEVKYCGEGVSTDAISRMCIEWTIGNKESAVLPYTLRESAEDARRRSVRGVTLCNRVFTEALDLRAKEYQTMIDQERNSNGPNVLKISNLENRMQALRPQRFSEGPLLFGLRHRSVQDHFKNKFAMGTKSSISEQGKDINMEDEGDIDDDTKS